MRRDFQLSAVSSEDRAAVRRWVPRGVVLFTCLLVLAGGLELHPAELAHEPGLNAERLFVCAGGETDAVHVEAAHAIEREPCPGCLHRLQTAASEASSFGASCSLDAADGSVAAVSPLLPTVPWGSARPRAPPRS